MRQRLDVGVAETCPSLATSCMISFVLTTVAPEIDRAADNLMKSGKLFGMAMFHGRRDSLPVPQGRPYNEYGKKLNAIFGREERSKSD